MRTRFAPSPTGRLHLGHAFSALTAWELARAAGGEFLLRIEDIDVTRARPEFEAGILEDLAWLGLTWPEPPMRQSRPAAGLCRRARPAASARARLSLHLHPRRHRRRALGAARGRQRRRSIPAPAAAGATRHRDAAWRLDLRRALAFLGPEALAGLTVREAGEVAPGVRPLDAGALGRLGDVVLARRDIGTSYHLAVVVDDAAQGVTHVVRGADLLDATPLHRLLQALLGLPAPPWHHHRLVRDETGRRLAKRDDARALATLRAAGATPADIRRMVGLSS